LKRYTGTWEHHDSCVLNVFVKDKKTRECIDTLSISSLFYLSDTFANCDSVMSFTTGFNSKRKVVDNYFGDLVVADLNFDKKDDIAIMNDYGGNGGPFYSYFIQGNFKKFSLDKFLTDSMTYFPYGIDKQKRRLTTYVHAGVCCTGEDVYQFDKLTGKWKHIIHKLHRD
jgi:hypothetical protein